MDGVFLFLDQVVVDFIRCDAELVGKVERYDLPRQLGAGHRGIGAHGVADLNNTLPGNGRIRRRLL